jgi:hypothetical protein
MNVIEVRCDVREYPDESGPYQTLIIRNHSTTKNKVVFEIEGKRYVFVAEQLKQAIDNASNAH